MQPCSNGYLFLVVGLFSVFVQVTNGFRCHVCSYSINSDTNTDCIYYPELLTGPTNFYACNRTCIIQENFGLKEQHVTSYMRTCSSVTKSGYCVQDPWSIVCYHSCIGELCNNYPDVLHTLYPVRNVNANVGDGVGDGDGGSDDKDSNSAIRVNGFQAVVVSAAILILWGMA